MKILQILWGKRQSHWYFRWDVLFYSWSLKSVTGSHSQQGWNSQGWGRIKHDWNQPSLCQFLIEPVQINRGSYYLVLSWQQRKDRKADYWWGHLISCPRGIQKKLTKASVPGAELGERPRICGLRVMCQHRPQWWAAVFSNSERQSSRTKNMPQKGQQRPTSWVMPQGELGNSPRHKGRLTRVVHMWGNASHIAVAISLHHTLAKQKSPCLKYEPEILPW